MTNAQKIPVEITLQSVQTDDDLSAVTTQTHQGVLYEREGPLYLLYDDAGTSTTLRFTPEEVRLYRRGEVNSWQVFQLGELTGGLLQLGGSEMILRVMTSHFQIKLGEDSGQIELHYELFTSETPEPDADPTRLSMGKFTLSLAWRHLAT